MVKTLDPLYCAASLQSVARSLAVVGIVSKSAFRGKYHIIHKCVHADRLPNQKTLP